MLGVGEPRLPIASYCTTEVQGVGEDGEDRQVGGAVDRWLSGWDTFQRTV